MCSSGDRGEGFGRLRFVGRVRRQGTPLAAAGVDPWAEESSLYIREGGRPRCPFNSPRGTHRALGRLCCAAAGGGGGREAASRRPYRGAGKEVLSRRLDSRNVPLPLILLDSIGRRRRARFAVGAAEAAARWRQRREGGQVAARAACAAGGRRHGACQGCARLIERGAAVGAKPLKA